MNNIIRNTLFFAVLIFVASCYKDLSTEATVEIPDIEIISDSERVEMYYGETFRFNPQVKMKGRNSKDFVFKWDMTVSPRGSKFDLELGDQLDLEFLVGNTPSSAPYILRLTVTDKKTGLVRSMCWDAYVSSSLGEGLLVAHTADGGQTSDLTLLSAKPVTAGYTSSQAKYTNNLYSLSNGAPIQGRVNSLLPVVGSNLATYNINRVYIGTDTDLISVNYLDYKEDVRNGSLFMFEWEGGVKVDHIFNFAEYSTGLITEGKFYNCLCIVDYLYSAVGFPYTPSEVFTEKNLTATKSSFGGVFLLDVNQGKFFFMTGRLLGASFNEMDVRTTYPIVGATPVACGIMKSDKVGFIVNTTDGNTYATVIESDGISATSRDYDLLSIAPDIVNAKGFAFCDNSDFFYYYTDSSINVVILQGNSATARKLAWTPEGSGEKITGLVQYSQGWYGTQQISISDYEHLIDTHRLQMIITTHNESTGEGKIYLRPYNVTTGLFTMQSNGTYGGFNEITAITPTLR